MTVAAVTLRDALLGRRIEVYDTTLRDGTQGIGVSFTSDDKIAVALRLDAFKVDLIEGGWPGSNPRDVAFFERMLDVELSHASLAAFGSTRRKDALVEHDANLAALLAARTPVVTLFGKSWTLHVREALGASLDQNVAMIGSSVAFMRDQGRRVVYDAEHFYDGFADDPDYALATLIAAAEAGAERLVLCDTNGGRLPEEIAAATRRAREHLAAAGARVPLGVHPHNDAGLAIANALAALREGASHVQGTIGGYGERCGNLDLLGLLPTLVLKLGADQPQPLIEATALGRFVDERANLASNPRAPYVGEGAFAHKGGMHVNAVQKLARSYEHIRPEEVGNRQHILVSELSGQSNVLVKAAELGFPLEKGSAGVKRILQRVKQMEKLGYEYEAADASFELLVREELGLKKTFFELLEFHTTHRHGTRNQVNTNEATVKLLIQGERIYTVEEGDGPVNALDLALRKALTPFWPQIEQVTLTDYKVRIINSSNGTAARTRVLIDSTDGRSTWGTVGVSDNIIDASWLALAESLDYYLQRTTQTIA